MLVAGHRHMADPGQLQELQAIDPGAQIHLEAGQELIHFPALPLPAGNTPSKIEALLCPHEHSGYQTRLFLSQQITGRGNNWTTHVIGGRPWFTWSWQGVSAQQRLVQILKGHLRGLQ